MKNEEVSQLADQKTSYGKEADNMKLSIAQIGLGIAISIMGVKVFLLPLGLAFLILGLAVLGVGIAQLINARR